MLTENHLILEFEDGEGVLEGENESHHKKLRDSLDDDKVQDHDLKVLMDKALRPKAMRWNISEASHIYLRRYRLRDSALEIFFIPSAGATSGGTPFFAGSRSLFIDFGAGVWGNTRRDDAANALMRRAPMQTVKQWPDKSGQFLHGQYSCTFKYGSFHVIFTSLILYCFTMICRRVEKTHSSLVPRSNIKL
jgi:hypothetical protein